MAQRLNGAEFLFIILPRRINLWLSCFICTFNKMCEQKFISISDLIVYTKYLFILRHSFFHVFVFLLTHLQHHTSFIFYFLSSIYVTCTPAHKIYTNSFLELWYSRTKFISFIFIAFDRILVYRPYTLQLKQILQQNGINWKNSNKTSFKLLTIFFSFR